MDPVPPPQTKPVTWTQCPLPKPSQSHGPSAPSPNQASHMDPVPPPQTKPVTWTQCPLPKPSQSHGPSAPHPKPSQSHGPSAPSPNKASHMDPVPPPQTKPVTWTQCPLPKQSQSHGPNAPQVHSTKYILFLSRLYLRSSYSYVNYLVNMQSIGIHNTFKFRLSCTYSRLDLLQVNFFIAVLFLCIIHIDLITCFS